MTDMTHTPGPWKFDKGLDGYGFNTLWNPELRVEVLAPNGQNGPDCAIVWMGEESSNADLVLIAAAPDLLAALQALLGACEQRVNVEGGDFGSGIGPAAAMATAAMARATGAA